MLIKAKSSYGSGVQIALSANNDLFVGADVTVRSSGDNAIRAATGHHKVTIAGTVVGFNGVELGGDVPGQRISVTKTGAILSKDGNAIFMAGSDGTIINQGQIVSAFGISLGGPSGQGLIVNSGTIAGGGITGLNDLRLTIRNTGLISDPGQDAITTSGKSDILINDGEIVGNVSLGDGKDFFSGRSGFVIGTIDGGGGNDTFRPGLRAEVIFGGADFDTLDFSAGGAIRVALDGSLDSNKAAGNDTYSDIEAVIGSQTGSDLLVGNVDNNLLSGKGGNDTIKAKAGQDTLVGGLGKDVLNGGGIGDDFFRFDKVAEGGDQIQDFKSDNGLGNNDTILIAQSGFQAGLALGTLAIGRFKIGTNAQAGDANDRFIFRTGDSTLWFDRDGTGAAPAVMIADLQNGATMTYLDIVIF